MELVISAIIGLLVCEVYVWLPKISDWLLERAVCRLQPETQERCREEWKAYLNDLPNTVVKLIHAVSYHYAVERINAEFIDAKCEELDCAIRSASDVTLTLATTGRDLKSKVQTLDELLKGVGSRVGTWQRSHNSIETPIESNSDAAHVLEELGTTLVRTLNHDWGSLRARLDKMNARIDQAENAMSTILAKHNGDVGRSIRKHTSEAALNDLLADAIKWATAFEGYDWHEEAAAIAREREKVATAMRRVAGHFALGNPLV
jgi:hypothetical protein